MNLTTIDGHSEAFVVKAAGTVAKDAKIQFATDLTEGEAVMVNGSNVVVDSTNIAAAGKVRLVTNRDGVLRYSEEFDADTIKANTTQDYVAPTYKSMAIGYNGTSGSMDITADRELTVSIHDQSKERLFETKEMLNLSHIVITESSTQADVTADLFKNLTLNTGRGENFVHVAMKLSGTVSTGAAAVVSNGGKTVTFATAPALIAVGGYLSFYGEFYKVVGLANTNKTITLDAAYQGVSGTVAVGNVKVMTVANANTANGGVIITVVERSHFRAGVTSAIVFDFMLGVKGFQVATVSTLAQSSQGSGTAKQIAELEWFAEGNQGSVNRMETGLGVGPEFIPSVNMAKNYDQTIVVLETQSAKTIIGGAPKFDNQLTLAVPTDVTCTAVAAIAALSA